MRSSAQQSKCGRKDAQEGLLGRMPECPGRKDAQEGLQNQAETNT